MKQALLLFSLFCFTLLQATAQRPKSPLYNAPSPAKVVQEDELKIYPNPTTNYISLESSEEVARIAIYNLVGRKMKEYRVSDGERYNVSDLPNGMYLVQLVDESSNVLTTQRLSKR